MRHSRYCNLHYSLLALSYLEVVVWSSCLLVSLACAKPVGTTDTQQYLLRETVNLKSVGGQDSDGELLELESEVEETPPPVLLWQAEKDRQQTDSLASWVVQFCGLGLSNLQVEDGLPGPYTGVKVVL